MSSKNNWHESLNKDDQKKLFDIYLRNHTENELKNFLSSKICWRRNITYDILPLFLSECGITVKEMLSLMGINVSFPNEEFAYIDTCCNGLLNSQVNKIYEIIKQMAPPLPYNDPKNGPLKRITSFYRATNSPSRYSNETREGIKKALYTFSAASTTLKDMVIISYELEISLHWILSLNDRTPIYNSNPTVDLILDYFSFAPPILKKSFLRMLLSISEEKRLQK